MRIDTQSHLSPEWYLDYLARRTTTPRLYERDGARFLEIGRWVRKVSPKATSLESKLRDMDAAGVDFSVISPEQPGPEMLGDDAIAIAQGLNDFIAETCRAHPDRFVGLTSLPLGDVTASLVELERCQNLGFRGVLLYANVNGQQLDDPVFRPLFAHAERNGLPLYLHPSYPILADATADIDMIPGFGFMVDTALAAIRLILSGTLETFPKLTIVLPHTGGVLPYLIGRIDDQVSRVGRGGQHIRRLPSAYLRDMYTDSVGLSALNVEFALRFWGPGHVLFASDHPFMELGPAAALVAEAGLSTHDLDAVFSGNARNLFRID